jgi:hypothetical protein
MNHVQANSLYLNAEVIINNTTQILKFLIDTGAAVSILARQEMKRFNFVNLTPSALLLKGIDNNAIHTHGKVTAIVALIEECAPEQRGTFFVADIKQNILGLDWLKKFRLIINLELGECYTRNQEWNKETNTDTPPKNATQLAIEYNKQSTGIETTSETVDVYSGQSCPLHPGESAFITVVHGHFIYD